jgi:hypothetical protein
MVPRTGILSYDQGIEEPFKIIVILIRLNEHAHEAPRSKSPTRQSCYGDGALQGILAKANKSRLASQRGGGSAGIIPKTPYVLEAIERRPGSK